MRAGWRLFKCLEERVLCGFVHAVGALDECDAAATFNGEEGETSGEGADWLDSNFIRSACWRDDDEVRVAPSCDEAARAARATGPTVDRRTAHERCDSITGKRPSTCTTRPKDQQGVRWCVGEECGEMRRGGVMTTSGEACRATRRVSGVRRR